MAFSSFTLLLGFLIFSSHHCKGSIYETTKVLNALLDPSTYDSRVRPNENGAPVKVTVNFFVASFDSLSETNMDYTVNVYLRQKWTDNRLRHNFTDPLMVPPKFVQKLWAPDLFFSNEKKGHLHIITQPNRYIRIAKDGEVLLSQRYSLTLSCPMALHKFPFDSQKCKIVIESYGYSTDDVVFGWQKDTPIQVTETARLLKYSLGTVDTGDCTKVYSTGAFTCIEGTFVFKRATGYYLFNSFVPSFIVTGLTWLAFWVSPAPAVTRITLISLCLLSEIGLMGTLKSTAPKVSYIVALDIWMVMSLVFIIVAMLETVFVTWMYQKGEQNEASEEKSDPGMRRKRSCCNWKGCANKIDILSRLLVPALYFGWAAFYCFVYTKFEIPDL